MAQFPFGFDNSMNVPQVYGPMDYSYDLNPNGHGLFPNVQEPPSYNLWMLDQPSQKKVDPDEYRNKVKAYFEQIGDLIGFKSLSQSEMITKIKEYIERLITENLQASQELAVDFRIEDIGIEQARPRNRSSFQVPEEQVSLSAEKRSMQKREGRKELRKQFGDLSMLIAGKRNISYPSVLELAWNKILALELERLLLRSERARRQEEEGNRIEGDLETPVL